jgi:Tol biopolymer transport system component
VLGTDGSQIRATQHQADDAVMGWSTDGAWLLFSSDRTGVRGLWGLSFANGKPKGSPQLLKPDIGSSVSVGLSSSGTLYVRKRVSSRDIALASVDIEAGKLLGPPVSFTRDFVDAAKNPSWSPDGKYLAYQGEDGAVIAIRSVADGQVRQIRTLASIDAGHLDWSPDGHSLLTRHRPERTSWDLPDRCIVGFGDGRDLQ